MQASLTSPSGPVSTLESADRGVQAKYRFMTASRFSTDGGRSPHPSASLMQSSAFSLMLRASPQEAHPCSVRAPGDGGSSWT